MDPILKLISDIALELFKPANFNAQINGVLEKIGTTLNVSRVYIFQDSEDGLFTSNTFEWCSEGISSEKENLQNIPYSEISFLKNTLKTDRILFSQDISEFPEDFYRHLKEQSILSILVLPLKIRHKDRGFIGFDECATCRKWKEEEINLLKTLSGILAGAFDKKLAEDKLFGSEKNFHALYDTVDDLILVAEPNGKILHANASALRRLNYTHSEITQKTLLDLHPEEDQEETKKYCDEVMKGLRKNCPLRLCTKEKHFISVETRVFLGSWNGKKAAISVSKDLTLDAELQQRFEKIFDNNPALMIITELPGRQIVDINESFQNITGFTKEEALGKTTNDLNLFEDFSLQKSLIHQYQTTGSLKETELQFRKKNGEVMSGLVRGEVIRNHGKSYLLGVIVDITEQIRLKNEAFRQRIRLENIVDAAQLGTWEWNIQTGETRFNRRWAEIIGYDLRDLQPVSIQTWEKFSHPEDLELSYSLLRVHFEGKTNYYECEARMKHKDGHWVWVQDRGKVVEWDKEGKPLRMFGTHVEITEKKILEQRLRENAIHDYLTKLYNRRHSFELLNITISKHKRDKEPFSVAILDLDHFKEINDEYGHLTGDFVLKEFATRLSENSRDYEILGRYGGEEFILISQGSEKQQTESGLKRLLENLKQNEFSYNGVSVSVTFSAGISDSSEFSVPEINAEKLISLADDRLYRAKEEGRARIVTD